MLELDRKPNIWNPPAVDAVGLAIDIRNDINARQCNQFLYIFRTVPYVDSIYIRYDSNREPKEIRRFAFHEGYNWDPDDEEYFNDHCVREEMCSYNGGAIETVYNYFQMIRPEWHVQRYYNKGLRLLDHIYNCMKQNTAKEILYKAGLDELAAHIDDLDELNLMAGKPSDIYDGVSMRVLKSLNCPYGSILLAEKSRREFVRELNIKFPDIFKSKLNDAMCRYITTLIKGDLTVGETGRLFQSRRSDLAQIWTMSFFDIFMARDLQKREMDELCKVYESMDPIYGTYIRHIEEPVDDFNLKQLGFYLLSGREEYDKAIRRSNRKRVYEWMERGDEYIVRYPQTINDFCREALYMENCLLTYIEALIENDTTILFMRKADDINTPFITIEIYDGQLMQAYHRFNKDCTVEEADWIRGYCTRHGIGLDKFSFNAEVDELF